MRIEEPTEDILDEAANAICRGELIVLPTETVYGLACNALDVTAVKKVYQIKARPSENPLIVHIASFDDLGKVAQDWPDLCEKLANRFWPGPLTMVLPKKPCVPDETTAGLKTVAVRIPSHRVAIEVIKRANTPVAAPSANPFMGLSPTSVDDLDPIIGDHVRMVIDGGPCEIGLESTVIDLTHEQPRILRPGNVTRAEIQAILGMPLGHQPTHEVHKSPGMYTRHYAPNAKLVIVEKLKNGSAGLTFGSSEHDKQIKMPSNAQAYGASLYRALKKLDTEGVEEIFVEAPPQSPEWEAVQDRLKKAAGPKNESVL